MIFASENSPHVQHTRLHFHSKGRACSTYEWGRGEVHAEFRWKHMREGKGRDNSVGIATRYGLDGPGIKSRWGRDFPHPSRPALGTTQPPVQRETGLARGERGRGVALTTHPHLASRLGKE